MSCDKQTESHEAYTSCNLKPKDCDDNTEKTSNYHEGLKHIFHSRRAYIYIGIYVCCALLFIFYCVSGCEHITNKNHEESFTTNTTTSDQEFERLVEREILQCPITMPGGMKITSVHFHDGTLSYECVIDEEQFVKVSFLKKKAAEFKDMVIGSWLLGVQREGGELLPQVLAHGYNVTFNITNNTGDGFTLSESINDIKNMQAEVEQHPSSVVKKIIYWNILCTESDLPYQVSSSLTLQSELLVENNLVKRYIVNDESEFLSIKNNNSEYANQMQLSEYLSDSATRAFMELCRQGKINLVDRFVNEDGTDSTDYIITYTQISEAITNNK